MGEAKVRRFSYPEFVDLNNIESLEEEIGKSRFRYSLIIPFTPRGEHFLTFIMKNPSTAGKEHADPTIVRVCKNAHNAGFDGAKIYNLFPYRSTEVSGIYTEYFQDPCLYQETMRKNLELIEKACTGQEVICAWGTNTIRKNHVFQAEYDRICNQFLCLVSRRAKCYLGSAEQPLSHPLYWRNDYLANLISADEDLYGPFDTVAELMEALNA